MRPRLGRPSLSRHASLFDLPDAPPGGLSVTFLGVATLLICDGQSAIMTDGFFSRPDLARSALLPLRSDLVRIDAALSRVGADRLDAVIPVHTHYDHALDSAAVAERSGAVLVGGASAAQIGRGHGLPEDRVVVASPGRTMTFGNFDVTLFPGEHCPPDRYPGTITAPVRQPARVSAYRCGEAWSTVIAHRPSGRSLLVVGSAGFSPGGLAGATADVAYLGVGQLGLRPLEYLEEYWRQTVEATGARNVVLIHWDDFFRPLDRPLKPLPFAVDDLDRSVRIVSEFARRDGVGLHLPRLWQHADPWA